MTELLQLLGWAIGPELLSLTEPKCSWEQHRGYSAELSVKILHLASEL